MDRRPFAASFPNAGNSNGTGAPSPRLGGENWEGLRLLFLLSSGGISFHRSLSTEEMSEDRVSVLFAERIDVIASYKRKREREFALEPSPPSSRCVEFFDERVGGAVYSVNFSK